MMFRMIDRRRLARSRAAAVTLDVTRDAVHIVTLDRPSFHGEVLA
jgi:hypothetical protein